MELSPETIRLYEEMLRKDFGDSILEEAGQHASLEELIVLVDELSKVDL